MLTYAQMLNALAHLLDLVNEPFWRDRITDDLRLWRDHHDVSGHLSSYGGMGSLNDLIICQANGHRVTEEQEPWANYLLNWLTSRCNHLAHTTTHAIGVSEIEREFGHEDRFRSVLLAHRMPKATETRRSAVARSGVPVGGWRCLHCGYAAIGRQSIDCFLASMLVPPLLIEGCRQGDLLSQVDEILGLRLPQLAQAREAIGIGLERSQIVPRASGGWLRPCPNCGSNNTAVYRWHAAVGDGLWFVPASDNLPLER
jgi:hypothetical protein